MLAEGVDFYYDENGLMVMTSHYLRRRGYCCQSNCRHCPYGFGGRNPADNPPEPSIEEIKLKSRPPLRELDDY